jgi:cytochrome c-type biogenesis protein CcmH
MRSCRPILIVLVALAVITAVWSTLLVVTPGQQTLDARVQRVASQLKCLICQGESVADSPSTLAQQMRAAIREQLQSGRSEQDVIQYFEQRYGAQIVWSPPWQGFSLFAWLVPIAFLLCGMGLVILLLREWRSTMRMTVGTVPCACPVPTGQNADLERYRAQLEAELAADDALFRKTCSIRRVTNT